MPGRRVLEGLGVLTTLLALLLEGGPAVAVEIDSSVYDRAALFMPENRERLAPNAEVRPHWRAGPRERFTYREELGEGRAAFLEVDAATGAKRAAFDPKIVAEGLSKLDGKPVDPLKLPFRDYEEALGRQIRVTVDGKARLCALDAPACVEAPAANPLEAVSPDGRWAAFVKDHNLWVRPMAGGEGFALTSDGAPHAAYGSLIEVMPQAVASQIAGHETPPVLLWSPDSRRIFIQKIDERKVRQVTIVRSTPTDGGVRPKAYTFAYAEPGDPDLPMSESFVADLASRTLLKVKAAPQPQLYVPTIRAREAWWSQDGSKLYLFTRPRLFKSMSLMEIDPLTGATRTIVSESGKTFVEPSGIGQRPMITVLKTGEVIWFSERDGHGRLYLLDGRTGAVERTLGAGAGEVTSVLRVDEAEGAIYALITGREPGADPYDRVLYKISLKDGAMKRLTPEDADHAVFGLQQSVEDPPGATPAMAAAFEGFSPSGRYFVDNLSRTDLPTRTVLRRADGSLVQEIEHADISRLKTLGVTTPERFTALAADGKTVLYGVIFRPTHFDPRKRYPVIDSPYPGPQSNRVHPRYLDLVFDPFLAQSFAELGFVVFAVDGRGTPGRGKAFLDESYGGLGQAGHLDDHVAVLKTLGVRYPYLDLDRTGIYGASGGGYATAHALFTYPDVFKVGVSDAGNHDQRGYIAIWGETYNGPETGDTYTSAANPLLAKNLKGKLLLMHGDMDTNVLPSQTFQVVDALIKANKDFDLLIVPNAGHTAMLASLYARRRAFDYMVKNLMGAEPPHEYDLEKAVSAP